MAEDPDLTPAVRGGTVVAQTHEDGYWPVTQRYSVVVRWDKREDRVVAKIVPTTLLYLERANDEDHE